MVWAEMRHLELVQEQWTWTVETDGVIAKASRKWCSDRPRGLDYQTPDPLPGVVRHQGRPPGSHARRGKFPKGTRRKIVETRARQKPKTN